MWIGAYSANIESQFEFIVSAYGHQASVNFAGKRTGKARLPSVRRESWRIQHALKRGQDEQRVLTKLLPESRMNRQYIYCQEL